MTKTARYGKRRPRRRAVAQCSAHMHAHALHTPAHVHTIQSCPPSLPSKPLAALALPRPPNQPSQATAAAAGSSMLAATSLHLATRCPREPLQPLPPRPHAHSARLQPTCCTARRCTPIHALGARVATPQAGGQQPAKRNSVRSAGPGDLLVLLAALAAGSEEGAVHVDAVHVALYSTMYNIHHTHTHTHVLSRTYTATCVAMASAWSGASATIQRHEQASPRAPT